MGRERAVLGRQYAEEELMVFYFLLWAAATRMFTFLLPLKLYIYALCTFMSVCYSSQ